MRAIKQKIRVPASRELNIKLPDEAVAHEEAEIIVLFESAASSPDDKFVAMESAMNDEMFLADLRETMEDFEHADREGKIAGVYAAGACGWPTLIQLSAPSRARSGRCSSSVRRALTAFCPS